MAASLSTETDICNLALFHVRAKEIGDIDEQSAQGEACRVLYPAARDYILSQIDWGFAKTTRTLSLKSEVPAEWDYLYDFPNDCHEVHYIVPPGGSGSLASSGVKLDNLDIDHIPYEIIIDSSGEKGIATNQESATLAYTKKVETVSLFTHLFKEAVAWRLAIGLATKLGGDSTKYYRGEAERGLALTLNQAQADSANQQWPRLRQQMPAQIRARRGSVFSHYHYNGRFYRRY